MSVTHQFGGAIALAWYRNPRATTDIDINVTVPPEDADPVLGALTHLDVSVSPADRALIKRDGQARLDWSGSYLDIFFATFELHREMAQRSHQVGFGLVQIPILSPEHLTVCKVVFDRPKDWLDVEEMIAWGTAIDTTETLGWIQEILGEDSGQYARLAALLEDANAPDRRSPRDAPLVRARVAHAVIGGCACTPGYTAPQGRSPRPRC